MVEASASHPYFDRAVVDALVKSTIDELSLVTWRTTSPRVSATVHEDGEGRPRLLFLINPTAESERASLDLGFAALATDGLEGTRHESRENRLTLSIPPRSVRMLKIDSA